MLLMLRLAPPVLVKGMDWGALVVPTCVAGNVRLVGDSETAAGMTPVPLRVTECGLPLALSKRVTPPLAGPVVCGVNVTLKVQLVSLASVAGQLFVCAKGKLAWKLLMFRSKPPVFVSGTVCAALVVPITWGAKVKLDGDNDTTGGVRPVPPSVTVWGLFAALSPIMI